LTLLNLNDKLHKKYKYEYSPKTVGANA